MSHHSTVPNPQTDITDLYIFQRPGNPTKSILIMNVNPFAPTRASTFAPEASYELKIDTNGDAEAEVAFHVLFSKSDGTHQAATVYRAAGEAARSTGPVGEVIIHNAPVSFGHAARITTDGDYRFYAGLRSDPWFADVDGVFNNFQFTGKDTFAEANIFGIVLEVPNGALGPGAQMGVWARTVALVDGELGQVDQVGRPLVTAVFNPTAEEQHHFVETLPSRQRAAFLPRFITILQAAGYAEADATRIAQELLPDILPYDYARPTGYPNGRVLTDDWLDSMIALITNGKQTNDLVGPHTDLLNDFPYLGAPHPTTT
ncbi:MAG: DUF4331 domain-containing protein [Anaerolineae bacterium]|nr:DUF4331 domain-containing protein [Anaerolineae bacterium]